VSSSERLPYPIVRIDPAIECVTSLVEKLPDLHLTRYHHVWGAQAPGDSASFGSLRTRDGNGEPRCTGHTLRTQNSIREAVSRRRGLSTDAAITDQRESVSFPGHLLPWQAYCLGLRNL
jgi:hypothetical protein